MGHFSPMMIEIFMEIQTGDDTNFKDFKKKRIQCGMIKNLSDKFLSRNYNKNSFISTTTNFGYFSWLINSWWVVLRIFIGYCSGRFYAKPTGCYANEVHLGSGKGLLVWTSPLVSKKANLFHFKKLHSCDIIDHADDIKFCQKQLVNLKFLLLIWFNIMR